MRRTLGLRNGKVLDLYDPDPEVFDVELLAMGLAREQRWGNQCLQEFSVAQHLLNTEAYLNRYTLRDMPLSLERVGLQLQGILHDASEFVIKDMASPMKKEMPEYYPFEHRVMTAICKRFDVPWPMDKRVKHADGIMLCTEFKWIMPPELHNTYEDKVGSGFPVEDPLTVALPYTALDFNVYGTELIARRWAKRVYELLRLREIF